MVIVAVASFLLALKVSKSSVPGLKILPTSGCVAAGETQALEVSWRFERFRFSIQETT